jgi:hypothetical protein
MRQNMSEHRREHVASGAHPLNIPEHCIRERAYEIYVQRGRKGGHADGDWLTAEAELKELKKKAEELMSAAQSLTADS